MADIAASSSMDLGMLGRTGNRVDPLAVLKHFIGNALEADEPSLPAMHWPPNGLWQRMEQGQ